MADTLKLKKRILKILQLFPVEEVEPGNKDVKFALKITPFEAKNFIIAVEYLPKIDMIRIVATVGIGKNLKDNFKLKNEVDKNEIKKLFSKPLRTRNFSPMLPKDFSVVQGFKLLIQQNFSPQLLLDTITDRLFVLQDLGELFYNADQSLKVPKVSESSNRMFQ